jgi:hypothetical protein
MDDDEDEETPSAPAAGLGPDRDENAVYGPGDPAYGPPDASWYERRQRERAAEDAMAQGPPPADASSARGPFEPPDKAEKDPWDDLLDDDYDERDSRDPLTRVKSLYQTAESLGDDTLDRRFEELLERQRKLITTFLDQSRPEIPDADRVIEQLTTARPS